jgi:uncharacterized phiE125 gp8 family phage protein
MILRLVTAPSVEPITVPEAKEHLHLEHALDDTYVTSLIKAAREYTEKICWRGLLSQTWEMVLGGFPVCDEFIKLPKGNLLSVTHVKYLDDDGVLTTMSSSTQYELDQKSVPGRVLLRYEQSWPSYRERWNAVQIEYIVGYGTVATDVPMSVRQAMLLLIAQMYEQRVPEITGTIVAKVGFAFDALIAPYRLRRFR